jgi:phenylacetate-CoA ligase
MTSTHPPRSKPARSARPLAGAPRRRVPASPAPAALDERETWPEPRWRRFQWRRLKRVVDYAFTSLPFYRSRFAAAGLTPANIRSPAEYARLPLLRKADVLQAMREAGTYAVGMEGAESALPPPPNVLGMTSGTLGTAVLAYPAAWRRATGDALRRAYWWAGLRPGMLMMATAPAWHSMAIQETRVVQRLGARSVVPWGTFLPRFAGEYLDTLLDLRPAFATFFLPMLYALLAECRRRGLRPADAFASLDTILVVGAPMTPRARLSLKEELGVRDVFEGAGNPEGLIAMECERHHGHHYFVDICFVEIVDPDTLEPLPAGRRGSIVISSLVPHGSVHLRYDTEDVGELFAAPCSCGRTWPLLEIYDRRANLFRVRGRELLWYDVRLCLDEVPELVGVPCAVIRERGGASALRLAAQRPDRGEPSLLLARLEQLVAQRLAVPLELEWVDALPVRWKGVTVIDASEWQRAQP